jgi:protein SCO1
MVTASCCQRTSIPLPAAPAGGNFSLRDHHGRRVGAHAFGDRLLLIFFGFTHCPLVCPRELAKIDAALALLGEDAAKIQPLYVSVDPERDTPPVMAAYLERAHPRFIGLTGTPDEIAAAKRLFRVFAEKRLDPTAPGGYTVPHTAMAYLAAPGGRYLAHFSDALDAEGLARALHAQLALAP